MAVVDVGIAVTDLFLLSDHVGLTEHRNRAGMAVFSSSVQDLDFAAVRIDQDRWHLVRARHLVGGSRDPYLRTHHAYVQPPVDERF